MDRGIRSIGFQRLENRYYTRLLERAPDPDAGKHAKTLPPKLAPVGVTVSIGTTPKESTDSDAPKHPEGWRSKPLPAELLATTKEQIASAGENAEVLKELPASEDPTRLALTEQANQFLLGEGDNPFIGLSRQVLSTISHNDDGTYTTTEIAAAMQEMSDNDARFWDETYKRINDAEIKNGNDDDTKPMMLKAQIKLFAGMSEAEKASLDYTAHSLTIELTDWDNAGHKTPEAVEYANLEEPEARVLAATTDNEGKAIWKQYSLKQLTAHTTTLSLLSGLPENTSEPDTTSATPKGQWLQVYAEIGHL